MSFEHNRVEDVFVEALELRAGGERDVYLDRACGADADLRARVVKLLAAHDKAAEAFLPMTGATAADASEAIGTSIGPYKLLQVIGEGGFGTVYLAEQEHPVRRRVAVKIIKLGMDTRQVIARFDAERQALAMMDHPNIAKVFDAGASDTGRPYFAMELASGIPITRYCDAHNLSIPQRLALFVQVCNATQHAHQKGVIHRDLKPSNVLVNTQDDRPHATIIDFGVAKATQARLTERTLFTEHRQLVGTPQYMSPEQANASLDIDTRADVYSLGVLLYELLTGATPFDPRELRERAYAEIQRVICDVDPPTPSTRLSTMTGALPAVAEHRSAEPKKLHASVRGELDWIVMKCLEKDRARRYESAAALAADVAHHLSDEPIAAARASKVYRFRKFVRRHKGLVMATAAVFAMLVAGVIGTSIGLIRESRQRAIADFQRDEAQLNLAESLFAQGYNRRAEPLYREWLSARANQSPDRQRARAIKQYALSIWRQRRYAEAEPVMRDAVATYRQVYPADDPEMVSAIGELGVVVRDQGRMLEAESIFREALAAASSVAIDRTKQDDANHRQHMLGEAKLKLAHLLGHQKRFDEADPHFRAGIDAFLREQPPRDWYVGTARLYFAGNLTALHQFTEAEAQITAAERLLAEYADQRQPVVYAAISLYTAWQQAEPAAGREALLQKWTAQLAPDYERRLRASALPAGTQPASTHPAR